MPRRFVRLENAGAVGNEIRHPNAGSTVSQHSRSSTTSYSQLCLRGNDNMKGSSGRRVSRSFGSGPNGLGKPRRRQNILQRFGFRTLWRCLAYCGKAATLGGWHPNATSLSPWHGGESCFEHGGGIQDLSAALWELILLGAPKLAIDPRPIGRQ